MIMSTVGRGGEGDVGQRIRDEILVIQVAISVVVIFIFPSGIFPFLFDVIKQLKQNSLTAEK